MTDQIRPESVNQQEKRFVPRRRSVLEIGVKQFIYSLIALLFCVILFATFLTDMESIYWQAGISLVCGLLFFLIVFSAINNFGMEDGNLVRFYQFPNRPMRGILACIIAAAPYWVFNLYFVLNYVPGSESGLRVVFNLINSPVFFINVFTKLDTPLSAWIGALLMPVIMLALTIPGYLYGVKGSFLLDKLLFRYRKDGQDPNEQPKKPGAGNYRI